MVHIIAQAWFRLLKNWWWCCQYIWLTLLHSSPSNNIEMWQFEDAGLSLSEDLFSWDRGGISFFKSNAWMHGVIWEPRVFSHSGHWAGISSQPASFHLAPLLSAGLAPMLKLTSRQHACSVAFYISRTSINCHWCSGLLWGEKKKKIHEFS